MCFLSPSQEALSLFQDPPSSKMLRTPWIQNPAFVEQWGLQWPIFSVPGHPIGYTCGIGTSKIFGDRKFYFLACFFSSHHASDPDFTSSAKIFFQETLTEYHILAACQDEYHPQDSWRTKGFQVLERAAEQLAPRPVHPTDGSRDHQGSAGNPEDQASWWNCLQHVHLLLREHQGIPCACHCSFTFHPPKGTWRVVKEAGQCCRQAGRNVEESPEGCWVQDYRLSRWWRGGPQVGDWADPTDAPRSPEGSQQVNCQDVWASEEPPVRWRADSMGLCLPQDTWVWLAGSSKRYSYQRKASMHVGCFLRLSWAA